MLKMSLSMRETATGQLAFSGGQVRLPLLDGVRGLAAMLVVLHHYVNPDPGRSLLATVIVRITGGMWCGVDLFFVLSGFLITTNLLRTLNEPRYFFNFYGRRLLRIFPLYYAILILATALAYALSTPDALEIRPVLPWLFFYATNILMSFWDYGGLVTGLITLNHLWSLAVEEHFYLVWPFLVRIGRTRFRMILGGVITIFIAIVFRLIFATLGLSQAAFLLTICRADSLAIGGLLAVIAGDARLWSRICRFNRLFAGVSILALACIIANYRRFHELDYWTQIAGYTLLALTSAALIVECLRPRTSALVQLAFGNTLMRRLGLYSYGIYIYHLALKPVFDRFLSTHALLTVTGNHYVTAALAHTISAIIVFPLIAAVSYHLFELPILRLKDRFFANESISEAPDRSAPTNVLAT
jgi:peptidoglycan/LPS O-acetylase OafA/YrhL